MGAVHSSLLQTYGTLRDTEGDCLVENRAGAPGSVAEAKWAGLLWMPLLQVGGADGAYSDFAADQLQSEVCDLLEATRVVG